MSDAHGEVFPPRDEWDIAAYDTDDIIDGYRDHRIGDDAPGPNWAPGYRWGWTNRRRDVTGENDGFEGIRSAYVKMARLFQ